MLSPMFPLNISLNEKAEWEIVSRRSIKINKWHNSVSHDFNSLNNAPDK